MFYISVLEAVWLGHVQLLASCEMDVMEGDEAEVINIIGCCC